MTNSSSILIVVSNDFDTNINYIIYVCVIVYISIAFGIYLCCCFKSCIRVSCSYARDYDDKEYCGCCFSKKKVITIINNKNENKIVDLQDVNQIIIEK